MGAKIGYKSGSRRSGSPKILNVYVPLFVAWNPRQLISFIVIIVPYNLRTADFLTYGLLKEQKLYFTKQFYVIWAVPRMNPYQQKKRWKYLLLAFAVVIAIGSLLYTRYLVKNIERSERTRAQVWAISMRQILASDDNDFLNYVIAVRDSLTVPAIVTDGKGEIVLQRGLDTTKTFIKLEAENNKRKKYDAAGVSSSISTFSIMTKNGACLFMTTKHILNF